MKLTLSGRQTLECHPQTRAQDTKPPYRSVPRRIDSPEQIAFAMTLADLDAEIAALEAKLVKARYLKQGVMQELLTGKMRQV